MECCRSGWISAEPLSKAVVCLKTEGGFVCFYFLLKQDPFVCQPQRLNVYRFYRTLLSEVKRDVRSIVALQLFVH